MPMNEISKPAAITQKIPLTHLGKTNNNKNLLARLFHLKFSYENFSNKITKPFILIRFLLEKQCMFSAMESVIKEMYFLGGDRQDLL